MEAYWAIRANRYVPGNAAHTLGSPDPYYRRADRLCGARDHLLLLADQEGPTVSESRGHGKSRPRWHRGRHQPPGFCLSRGLSIRTEPTCARGNELGNGAERRRARSLDGDPEDPPDY